MKPKNTLLLKKNNKQTKNHARRKEITREKPDCLGEGCRQTQWTLWRGRTTGPPSPAGRGVLCAGSLGLPLLLPVPGSLPRCLVVCHPRWLARSACSLGDVLSMNVLLCGPFVYLFFDQFDLRSSLCSSSGWWFLVRSRDPKWTVTKVLSASFSCDNHSGGSRD